MELVRAPKPATFPAQPQQELASRGTLVGFNRDLIQTLLWQTTSEKVTVCCPVICSEGRGGEKMVCGHLQGKSGFRLCLSLGPVAGLQGTAGPWAELWGPPPAALTRPV